METARDLIEQAFARLNARPGYAERPDQRQMALLLSDLVEQGENGMIEAPTGLGKSLACLLPALAHAAVNGKRSVIATYTNVLTEQYWRQDLPLAQELIGRPVSVSLLLGRQRYVCQAELMQEAPQIVDDMLARVPQGIESEVREAFPAAAKLWRKIVTPPACPARACPFYDSCYYYSARRKALKSMVVITNHAIVLQEGLMTRLATEEEEDSSRGTLYGKIDFLYVDEAHDLYQAATNAFEIVIDQSSLDRAVNLAGRIENLAVGFFRKSSHEAALQRITRRFREETKTLQHRLLSMSSLAPQGGILGVEPPELKETPTVSRLIAEPAIRPSKELVVAILEACADYAQGIDLLLREVKDDPSLDPSGVKQLIESSRNYLSAIRELGIGATQVANLGKEGVSYMASGPEGPFLRTDPVNLAEPLTETVWEKQNWVAFSATLALDGSFDHFSSLTGAKAEITDILRSPFDYETHAALYLPPSGQLIDPTSARKMGMEQEYFAGVAQEVSMIIETLEGRCLVLFHSRREMEAVRQLITVSEELPILVQPRFGAGQVGERFRKDVATSLFALRSFWTGFDAPGETLSGVVLVRIPFEVPTDPLQVVRAALLRMQGRDAFRDIALPNAKMLVRQGVGRLIRRAEDKGIIALLDARLRTKAYGEEILANLPSDLRTFSDIRDAVGWVGLA